jgi:hypothetical protein
MVSINASVSLQGLLTLCYYSMFPCWGGTHVAFIPCTDSSWLWVAWGGATSGCSHSLRLKASYPSCGYKWLSQERENSVASPHFTNIDGVPSESKSESPVHSGNPFTSGLCQLTQLWTGRSTGSEKDLPNRWGREREAVMHRKLHSIIPPSSHP